jgi:phosphoribosylformylglycinamidine (FGAM) synthase PurS component
MKGKFRDLTFEVNKWLLSNIYKFMNKVKVSKMTVLNKNNKKEAVYNKIQKIINERLLK